jgi:hypothetical protein
MLMLVLTFITEIMLRCNWGLMWILMLIVGETSGGKRRDVVSVLLNCDVTK